MSDGRQRRHPQQFESVPVFPLPRVVLFPGVDLPLHLFEPRYRELIRDRIDAQDPYMVVALLKQGWEADYYGQPPIHTIAGLGQVVDYTRLPDGTYNVLLRGVARVQLRELPRNTELYRKAEATVIPDEVPEGGIAPTEVASLLSCASSLATQLRRTHPDFSLDVSASLPPAQIADVLAHRFILSPETRQAILETVDVHARWNTVMTTLVELLANTVEEDSPRRGSLAH